LAPAQFSCAISCSVPKPVVIFKGDIHAYTHAHARALDLVNLVGVLIRAFY
jgi:hypothetical protein